jgi:hypothetical protein
MPSFTKLRQGQRWPGPSASFHNATVDAIEAVRALQQGSGDDEREPARRNTNIVTVKNNSGGDVNRFGVLGINDALFTPTDNGDLFKSRVIINGDTPSALHQGRFVVLLEPIADGKLGRGYVAGTIPCKIDVIDTSHDFADVKPADDVSLKSRGGYGSARILYKESGTGVKLAYVELTPAAPGVHFYVALTQTGGSNGTDTTAATWTYTAVSVTGAPCGTAMAPDRPRGFGTFAAATKGVGYYDNSGDFKLADAYETPGTEECEEA